MAALVAVVAGNRIVVSDLNQLVNLLTGVTGSGTTITLINNAESLIFQPSSDPAAGTRVWTVKNNAGTVLASMRFDGLLKLLSAAAAPATPVTGSLYWDSVLTSLQVYNGTAWDTVSSTSSTLIPNQMFWYWLPGIAIENTNTGTGAYTTPTNASHGLLSCGATSGSNCGLRKFAFIGSFGTGLNGTNRVRQWSFLFATDKAASEAARIFITDESVTGQPSLTAKHMGIRWDGTTAFFSTADGTTEQTTDITANIAASTDHRALVTFDGTTAKLYLDGTLRATHATNIPTSAGGSTPVFRAHIVNSTAADRLLYVGAQSVWMAA